MKKLILGSASPRRRELLEQIGIPFQVLVNSGDENYHAEEPAQIVQELALKKAENTAQIVDEKKETIILGADTIVVLDGNILGKPKDEREAAHMLSSLSNRAHDVYTGTAFLVYDKEGTQTVVTHAEKTRVYVHELSEDEIHGYIKTGDPMDKAGAYGIQGPFAAFIDRIEGDYYNVVGLPLAYVYQMLKEF